jgi:hypothetical protein
MTTTTEHVWGFQYAFFPLLCARCHVRHGSPAAAEPCGRAIAGEA